MTFRPLLGIAILLAAGTLVAAEPAFSLKGKVANGDDYVFNVKPAGARAEWLGLGEVIGGYTLVSFDHATNTLSLKKGGTLLQISMDAAVIGENVAPTAEELRQRDKERMLRMKPALEAGQPIRGTLSTQFNGPPQTRTVGFVVGQEMRLDLGNGTTGTITPKLNEDGSVSYDLQMKSQSDDGSQRTMSMRMTAAPWGKFTLRMAPDRQLSFAPDDPDRK